MGRSSLILLFMAWGAGAPLVSTGAPAPGQAARGGFGTVPFPEPRVAAFSFQDQTGRPAASWRMSTEDGIVTYEVERDTAQGWRKLSSTPVPAQTSPAGADYEVIDALPAMPGPRRYRVLARDEHGAVHVLGPFQAAFATATWSASPATATKADAAWSRAVAPKETHFTPPVNLADATTPWRVRITTREAGLHLVTAESLAALTGQPVAVVAEWLAGGVLSLTCQGDPVTWFQSPFEPPALVFCAETHRDNYSDRNVYWLAAGANAPALRRPADPTVPAANSWYPAGIHEEQDSSAVLTLTDDPAADFWMGARLVAGVPLADTARMSLALDPVAPEGDDARAQLSLRLVGGSVSAHAATIQLNGQALGEVHWTGKTPALARFEISPAELLAGGNSLALSALRLPQVSGSQWYVDWVEIEYPRPCVASAGRLEFSAPRHETMTVRGFSNRDVALVDVSHPRAPVLLEGGAIAASGGGWQVSFLPLAAGARSVAFEPGAVRAPLSLEVVPLAGLAAPTNAAEYVIVAPAALAPAAEALLAHRQPTLASRLITLEQVENEFSHGLRTPLALRAFLTAARANWAVPPRYLLLFGNGTYDARDRKGAHDCLVPTLLVRTVFGLATSDQALGDLDDDGRPEVAVGRLPVRSADESAQVVRKLIAYESRPPAQTPTALLVADEADTGGDFPAGLEALQSLAGGKFALTSLASTNAAEPAALRLAIQRQLAAGTDIFDYVGHGAIDRLGTAGYFTSADVAALPEVPRLPVLVAATCVAGQYSVPGYDSLAETAVLAGRSGAIAVIAPSGLSVNRDAVRLNQRLVAQLAANRGFCLGDLFRESVREYYDDDPRRGSVAMYNLIGDPGMVYGILRDRPVDNPVLRIVAIHRFEGRLELEWSGARAPYQLQWRAAWDPEHPWSDLGPPTSETHASVPVEGGWGWLRLKAGE